MHPAIDSTIRHCLEKNPLERFQSAHDLVFQLETATEGRFPKTGRARPKVFAIAAAILLLLMAGSATFWIVRRPRAAPTHPLVAIQHFKNLSADPAQEYFTSGMTEEIRDQLSKISAIRLLSRSAVDRYREGDIRRIGNELGAGSVVEGSVRLDKNRMRIAV